MTETFSSSPNQELLLIRGRGPVSFYLVHLYQLKGQVEITVIILNPTFLVFIQFVVPRFYLSEKPAICPIDQQVRPP